MYKTNLKLYWVWNLFKNYSFLLLIIKYYYIKTKKTKNFSLSSGFLIHFPPFIFKKGRSVYCRFKTESSSLIIKRGFFYFIWWCLNFSEKCVSFRKQSWTNCNIILNSTVNVYIQVSIISFLIQMEKIKRTWFVNYNFPKNYDIFMKS